MQSCFFFGGGGVGSCAKFHILSQLIVFFCFVLSEFTTSLFQLVYVIISKYIGNPFPSIQVLLVVF